MEDRDLNLLLKLLALTSSPNEAEAQLASQRAQELLERLGHTWDDVITQGTASDARAWAGGPNASPAAEPWCSKRGAPARAPSPEPSARVRRSLFGGFLQWIDYDRRIPPLAPTSEEIMYAKLRLVGAAAC